MCLNCGCMMPDDDMGHPDNIIVEDLAKGAIASEENGTDTLRHMKETLEIVSPEMIDKKIEELKSKKQES